MREAARATLLGLLGAAGGCALLLLALAAALPPPGGDDGLGSFGTWSLRSLFAVGGLVGGGLLGLVTALLASLGVIESELRVRLERQAPADATPAAAGYGVAELRQRYEGALDRLVGETIGRLPLPPGPTRFVRRRIGAAVVEDFLAEMERSGTTTVGPRELRRWMLARGPSYAFEPVRAQLRTTRLAVAVLLGVAAVAPMALRLM